MRVDAGYGDAIVVAEMDGEANEVAGIRLRRYPTLLLFDTGNHGGAGGASGSVGGTPAPREYKGKHSVDGMMAFIAKYATVPSAPAATEEGLGGGGVGGVEEVGGGGLACADGDNECKAAAISSLAQSEPLAHARVGGGEADAGVYRSQDKNNLLSKILPQVDCKVKPC